MRIVIIGFGLLAFSLLILFKISEINFTQGNVRLEVVVAIAALIFFFIGVYFNRTQTTHDTKADDQVLASTLALTSTSSSDPIDYEQLRKTGLTQREHEVLLKMAEGMSNQEIAAALFLSESTIKTHVSNILFKLDVKRRTAAIQTAKQLKLIPG